MSNTDWETIIEPKSNRFDLNLKEVIRYKDLLFLFVRRDLIANYKQTVLGPIWILLQPVMTSIIYVFVFGNIAGLSTDGLPKMLFYMSGVTAWKYFADCLNNTSNTFVKNAGVFGKVYFPRIIRPISVVFVNLVNFGVQFLLLVFFYIYFVSQGFDLQPRVEIYLLPVLLIIMMLMGLGFGFVLSAMTAKYRDLRILSTFGVQLLMYLTPVVYPISSLEEKYQYWILANPMTAIIETFRTVVLGTGEINYLNLMYSGAFALVVFIFGLIIFNRTARNFMDTV